MSQDALAIAERAKVVVYRPRDPAALSRAVVVALVAYLAITLTMIFIQAFHLSVLSRFDPSTVDSNGASLPGERPSLLLIGLGTLLWLPVLAVCQFLSLKWVYRVSMNAHTLVRGGMSMSPAWNVGYFFVPIAFLWMPLKGLRESWAVSANPVDWKGAELPSILGWWWGFWILSSLAGNLAFRFGLNSGTVSAASASDIALIASNLLDLPAGLLFIVVVRRLTALQVGALASHSFA